MIRLRRVWIPLAILLTAVTAFAGGPPILTLSKMPEYFVVGQAQTLEFFVRAWCCDNAPLGGKSYTIRVAGIGVKEIEVSADTVGDSGKYTAELILPSPGEWNITVDFSHGSILSPQIHRKAILSGSPPPVVLSIEALGRRDFVEKGCIMCHVNRDAEASEIGTWADRASFESSLLASGYPDLTGRTFPDDYLVKVLANPPGIKPGTKMPNLGLGKDDIAALAAFINRGPLRTTEVGH